MKRNNDRELRQELEQAGSSEAEAKDLAQVAKSISKLRGHEPEAFGISDVHLRRRRWEFGSRVWWFGAVATSFIAGAVVVSVAQGANPGGGLYSVKRASETVVTWVQPDYRGTIMMRRAQELRTLVASNQNDALISKSLQDYHVAVLAYRGKSYPTIEYCRRNLQQAEALASGQVKQQIAVALANMPNIQD